MTSVVDAFRAFGTVLTEPTLLIAPDRRIITGNSAARATFGPRALQGRPLSDLVSPLRQDLDEWLDLCFGSSQLTPGCFRRIDGAGHAHVFLEGGGFMWDSVIYALVRVRHHDAYLHRVLQMEERQERLQAESEHDYLTGLFNRKAFEKRLAALSDGAVGERKAVTVILIDIDHFKRYNDHYGHAAGDQCLRRVSQRLATVSSRHGALAARVGGEEFAIAWAHRTYDEAAALAAELVEGVRSLDIPHAASFSGNVVTISAGLATAPGGTTPDLERLQKVADGALYEAKRKGRDRYQVARHGSGNAQLRVIQ